MPSKVSLIVVRIIIFVKIEVRLSILRGLSLHLTRNNSG